MEHRGLRAAGLDTGPVRLRVCPATRSLMPAFAIPLRVSSHTGGCSLPAPGRPCWPPALPLHRLSTQSQPSAVPSLWPHNSASGQSACVGPASQTGPLPTHVRPAPHWPRTLVPRPITEVLRCGHPPLPETHSACAHCPGPVLRGASGRPSHGLRQRSALLLDSADHGTKEMRAWHLRREPDSHP